MLTKKANVILIFITLSFARDFPILPDGEMWAQLGNSETAKLAYLLGYSDGLGTSVIRYQLDLQKIPDLPYSEIINEIDRFYSNPENRFVLIYKALEIISFRYYNKIPTR